MFTNYSYVGTVYHVKANYSDGQEVERIYMAYINANAEVLLARFDMEYNFISDTSFEPVELIKNVTILDKREVPFVGSFHTPLTISGTITTIDGTQHHVTGIDDFWFVTDDCQKIHCAEVAKYSFHTAPKDAFYGMYIYSDKSDHEMVLYDCSEESRVRAISGNNDHGCCAIITKRFFYNGCIVKIDTDMVRAARDVRRMYDINVWTTLTSLKDEKFIVTNVRDDDLIEVTTITGKREVLPAVFFMMTDGSMNITNFTTTDNVMLGLRIRKNSNDKEYIVKARLYNGSDAKYLIDRAPSVANPELGSLMDSTEETLIRYGYPVTEDSRVVDIFDLQMYSIVGIDRNYMKFFRERCSYSGGFKVNYNNDNCFSNDFLKPTQCEVVKIKTIEKMCEEYGTTSEGMPKTIASYNRKLEELINNCNREVAVTWVSDDSLRFGVEFDGDVYILSSDMIDNGGYHQPIPSVSTEDKNYTEAQINLPDLTTSVVNAVSAVSKPVLDTSITVSVYFDSRDPMRFVTRFENERGTWFATHIGDDVGVPSTQSRGCNLNLSYPIAEIVRTLENYIAPASRVTYIKIWSPNGQMPLYERGVKHNSNINTAWICDRIDNSNKESQSESGCYFDRYKVYELYAS